MNRKQFMILVVAGVIIGGMGWALFLKRSASWQTGIPGATSRLLGDFPINDVAQVLIRQGTNALHLAKGETLWQVQERSNYPANFSEISELVRKLYDLKPVQSVKVGPSQYGRLELLSPGPGTNTATVVEFKDKGGKALATLWLGKKHTRSAGEDSPFGGGGGGWPDGRYVMVPGGSPAPVWLIADPLSNVEPKPESWLNKDFVKVEKLKSISVTPTNAAQAWSFARETESGDLKLQDRKEGEEPDANKITGLVNVLSYATFNDVLARDAEAEKQHLGEPVGVALETFEGFHYKIKIGSAASGDNHPMTIEVSADFPSERTPGKDEKPEDKEKLDKEFKDKLDKHKEKLSQEKACEKWIYLVSKWTVENLLKDRTYWMVDKKTETKAEENDSSKNPEEEEDISIPGLPPIPADPTSDKDVGSEPQ